jgi:hypothetical protein
LIARSNQSSASSVSLTGARLFARRKKLERDGALELGVLGLIHHSHSTFAQLLKNAEVRDCCPDHKDLLWWESALTVTAGKFSITKLLEFRLKGKWLSLECRLQGEDRI